MYSWRRRLLTLLGPGLCSGMTLGDWLSLLLENRFAIDPPYWPRAATISACSLVNSLVAAFESAFYALKIRSVQVKPPIFILGFPRSGTTHLHNLLTVDQRFAYPNLYQVYFPRTFLSTELALSRAASFFLPRQRPQDNVKHNFQAPAEDEWATCITTRCSPYVSPAFRRHEDYYSRYWTFRGVAPRKIVRWKAALVTFLKKLTWKYDRPLILKSPPHTGRISLLLDLFPAARFIHIHRDPCAVIQSNIGGRLAVGPYMRLQRDYSVEAHERRILQYYKDVYDAFFDEQPRIPDGQFHELGYEDLVNDPLGEVRKVYERLRLPSFEEVEPDLRKYLESVETYRKNRHAELPPARRREITRFCQRSFEAWGYPIEEASMCSAPRSGEAGGKNHLPLTQMY